MVRERSAFHHGHEAFVDGVHAIDSRLDDLSGVFGIAVIVWSTGVVQPHGNLECA